MVERPWIGPTLLTIGLGVLFVSAVERPEHTKEVAFDQGSCFRRKLRSTKEVCFSQRSQPRKLLSTEVVGVNYIGFFEALAKMAVAMAAAKMVHLMSPGQPTLLLRAMESEITIVDGTEEGQRPQGLWAEWEDSILCSYSRKCHAEVFKKYVRHGLIAGVYLATDRRGVLILQDEFQAQYAFFHGIRESLNFQYLRKRWFHQHKSAHHVLAWFHPGHLSLEFVVLWPGGKVGWCSSQRGATPVAQTCAPNGSWELTYSETQLAVLSVEFNSGIIDLNPPASVKLHSYILKEVATAQSTWGNTRLMVCDGGYDRGISWNEMEENSQLDKIADWQVNAIMYSFNGSDDVSMEPG